MNRKTTLKNIKASITTAQHQAEKDPTRPMYHFRPPAQWMNDPNGTIYYHGYYHLFYQFNPYSEDWGSIHWGHARSRDLVHWEHLPIALFPEGKDEAHCASGCATINGNGIPMAFYTNFTEALEAGSYDQRIALGDADLITWEKYSRNPFLGTSAQKELDIKYTWRDPFIFQENGRTFLLLGAETEDTWLIPIYEAEDKELLSWSYRGKLYESPKNRPSHFLFECPNFMKIDDKWVLLYSPMGSGVEYLVGSFDSQALTFHPEHIGILDNGYRGLSGFYATNTLFDPQGRCILFGWIRGFTSGRGWNGCLALPRVLSLGKDGHVRQHPVPELQQLRSTHWNVSQIELHNSSRILQGVQGKQLEILAQFEIQDANQFGLKIRCAADGSDGIPIAYDAIAHDGPDLKVDGVRFRFTLAEDETILTFHIFLDRSVMEVFVNDGYVCATRVIYPPEKNLGIAIFSQGGNTTVTKLDIWEMQPVW